MSSSTNAIHLAISFDQGYVPFVYVLLVSVFSNNVSSTITVHAIAPEVSIDEQTTIKRFVQQQGGSIHFYELDASFTQGFALPNHKTAYFTLANYYRLFFANLVPDSVDKLLYLDIDTLVVGSLNELFHVDLGDLAIGAVQDVEMHVRTDLGLTSTNDYFNSGVLLINLPQWRQQQVTARACDIILRYPDKVRGWVDQDALNMLFQGEWYRLDWRYNVMNGYVPYDLPRRHYKQFLVDKAIIHFTGTPKPWHWACENKFRFLYPTYLRQVPPSYVQRHANKKITWQAFTQLVYKRMLETYFNYPEVGQAWRRAKILFRR